MSGVAVGDAPARARAGLFGKIPAHGDFVNRGLPAAFVERWDRWLRACLGTSRAALGGDWMPLFLTCPVWRFALAPGLCGRAGYVGLMCPSVDRVGRYFPIVVAAALGEAVNPLIALGAAADWLDEAERLVLGALDGDLDADALAAALAETPVLSAAAGPALAVDGPPGVGLRVTLPAEAAAEAAAPALLDRLMAADGQPYGIWRTAGSERVAGVLLTCRGLPADDRFAAFLDGDWARWGWDGALAMRLAAAGGAP